MMNLNKEMDPMDPLLEDHLDKCRCCFRILVDNQRSVKISNLIQNRYFALTQIELIDSEQYSSKICELCDRDLKNFSYLKKDLCHKQKRLYQLIPNLSQFHHELNNFQKENPTDKFVLVEALDENVEYGIDNALEAEVQESVKAESRHQHCIEYSITYEEIQESDSVVPENATKKSFQCSECGLTLASNTSLKRHVDRIHAKIRRFTCDHCGYKSFFKHGLEKHVLKHIPEALRERLHCKQCSFTSISSINFGLHMKYEHSDSKQIFVCHCGKSFARPGQLSAHVRLAHDKQKNSICNTCKRSFSTLTRLKEHVISAHIGTRDYVCNKCGKQYMTQRQLKCHQIYHEEPKYCCQMGCDKRFFKPVLLKNHHKTHTGEKSFVCPHCNMAYFLLSHMKRHIKSVHENSKIQCELCLTKFARKENYRKHVMYNHKDLTKQNLEALLEKIRKMKF